MPHKRQRPPGLVAQMKRYVRFGSRFSFRTR